MMKSISKLIGAKGPNGVEPVLAQSPVFEPLEDRVLLSLLGIAGQIDFPRIAYDATGTLAYNPVTHALDVSATPVSRRMSSSDTTQPVFPERDFELHILVDNTGNVVAGVPGDDLVIIGNIDTNNNTNDGFELSGVLLTGEILDFGYLDSGATDQYDFRFQVTGGALVDQGYWPQSNSFPGIFKDIGITLTSPNSTFTGSFATPFNGGAQGNVGPIEPIVVAPQPESFSLAGYVYNDTNNDGSRAGDTGIGGINVTLTGTTASGANVNISTTTSGVDGSYVFAGLEASNANGYTITATQAPDLLDGKETAGTRGGTVDNTQDSQTISNIVLTNDLDPANNNGEEYNFGEIVPSTIMGLVYLDANDDGLVDADEVGIANVEVQVSGTDDRGNTVNTISVLTDSDGAYTVIDLRPGTYTIQEIQPAGYADGKDTVGTVNGVPSGVNSSNDRFTGVVLPSPGSDAENYNFGEREQNGDGDNGVDNGQTATIGFWHNKNGQNLIKSLNGGQNATNLSTWLATNFENMYGAAAGDNDLTGYTNKQVAAFFSELYKRNKKTAAGGGPPKMDAQILATAFAVYVTDSDLAGNAAVSYGFMVDSQGVGARTWNVGDNGEAFGVADFSDVTVMDLLEAVNDRTSNGLIYDLNGDGDTDDEFETLFRTMANDIFSAINEAGNIG